MPRSRWYPVGRSVGVEPPPWEGILEPLQPPRYFQYFGGLHPALHNRTIVNWATFHGMQSKLDCKRQPGLGKRGGPAAGPAVRDPIGPVLEVDLPLPCAGNRHGTHHRPVQWRHSLRDRAAVSGRTQRGVVHRVAGGGGRRGSPPPGGVRQDRAQRRWQNGDPEAPGSSSAALAGASPSAPRGLPAGNARRPARPSRARRHPAAGPGHGFPANRGTFRPAPRNKP